MSSGSFVLAREDTSMKRLLIALLILLSAAVGAEAQTISVSLSVTDSGSQSWNSGTWSVVLDGPVSTVCPAGATPPQSGTLSATGTATITLADNATCQPSGTKWRFTVCPQPGISSGCFSTSLVAAPTVALTPPAISIAVPTTQQVIKPVTAYADSEISGGWLGFTYYNVTTVGTRQCTAVGASGCTTWGAGGGVSPIPGVFQSNLDPPLYQNYSLTTTGAQAGINLTATPIDTHTISWRPSGTVSTCTVALDTSPDGVSWTAGAAIPGQTCTAAGQFSTASPVVANFVRVNLTTLTGGGTVAIVYSGRLAQSPFSEGGGGPTIPCAGSPTGLVIKQGDYIIQNDTGNTGGASFTLTYRMILATGERKEFQNAGLAGAAGNGPAYNFFPLPEGCLTAVSLTLIGGSVDSGQTVAQVFVGRNASPVPNASSTQILACQLSSNYSCGWPGTWRAPTDGQGLNQSCTIANPAAGADLSQNINTGTLTCNGVSGMTGQKHWLSNIRFTLTTDANAAARQVCIKLTNANGNGDYGYCMQATQAASTIVTYDFTAGVGPTFLGGASLPVIPTTNVAGTANEVQGTLPSNFQYFDATVLSTRIVNKQVADQLSAIVVRIFWSHHDTD